MPTKKHPSSTATIPKWSPVYMCELVKNKHTSHTNTQSNHIHIIFPLKYILSVHSGAGPYRQSVQCRTPRENRHRRRSMITFVAENKIWYLYRIPRGQYYNWFIFREGLPLPVISSCDPIGLLESGKGFKKKGLLRQTGVKAFLSDTEDC